MKHSSSRQSGTTLIEVLVAILILSFGILALGGMLAYAVQMPKLSAMRASAISLAAGHVERMRANPSGFSTDSYLLTSQSYPSNSSYNQTLATVTPCVYPNCTSSSIAALDTDDSNRAIRKDLPLGGMSISCEGLCANLEGHIWVMWQEPAQASAFNTGSSDECPGIALSPAPRCVHIRFKL
jgi:type IV pilus assembly protein PilV